MLPIYAIKKKIFVFLYVALKCSVVTLFYTQYSHAQTMTFESSSNKSALVELYTSEGCSSCPPAERWFSNFSNDKRLWKQIFPIAFHVDYWDYLGWRDSFASPAFSLRQRKYERYGYTHNVATPGFVVDGKGWNGWFRGQSLPEASSAIDSHSTFGLLKAELNNQSVRIDYSPSNTMKAFKNSPKVHVAVLGFGIVTPVKGGENSGRNLTHDFVVVGYQDSHLLETGSNWAVNVKRPNTQQYDTYRQAVVVWVSDGDDPRPVQVTGGWLTSK